MTNELIPATMHPTNPKFTSTVAKGTSEKLEHYVTFPSSLAYITCNPVKYFQVQSIFDFRPHSNLRHLNAYKLFFY
jgi:hypothetical protein